MKGFYKFVKRVKEGKISESIKEKLRKIEEQGVIEDEEIIDYIEGEGDESYPQVDGIYQLNDESLVLVTDFSEEEDYIICLDESGEEYELTFEEWYDFEPVFLGFYEELVGEEIQEEGLKRIEEMAEDIAVVGGSYEINGQVYVVYDVDEEEEIVYVADEEGNVYEISFAEWAESQPEFLGFVDEE